MCVCVCVCACVRVSVCVCVVELFHNPNFSLQAQVERFKSQLSSLEEETREARTTREKNMVLIEELQEKLLQRDSLVARLESEISSRQKIIDQVKAREKKANEEIEAVSAE